MMPPLPSLLGATTLNGAKLILEQELTDLINKGGYGY